MRTLIGAVLCAVALSLFADTPAHRLNQRLFQLESLKANYIQTSDDPISGDIKVVQGDVLMQRPNQFRWRIEKPYHQELLSDGQKLYIYDKDLDQVVVRTLTAGVQDAPALLLIGKTSDVSQDFNVSHRLIGGYQDVFTLTPKDQESMIKSIQLVYLGSAIQSMRFQDTLEQVVDIQFTALEQNTSLPTGAFIFKAPKGVDILRE